MARDAGVSGFAPAAIVGGLASVGVPLLTVALVALMAALVVLAYRYRALRRSHADLGRALTEARSTQAERLADVERERETLDAILSSLDEGVVLFDADGAVLYRNDGATDLLRGEVDDARSLLPAGLRRLVQESWSGFAVRSEEILTGETPARWILATAMPMERHHTMLLVLRDVTEARRVESVRRDFVANASHELKTPAASIQALAETIAAAAESDLPAVPRFADQLEREAARMTGMVADLLDLSRLEGEPGERSEVRLDHLVREEAERQRGRAEELGLTFTVEVPAGIRVSGSSRELSLLVRNLVENAVQYSRPGGTVEVTLSATNGEAKLEVRDTGVGIPSRDISRVFERFYRVDRARSRDTGGTGLGLSIVKHVAESHRGTVDVESTLGEGTAFTVRLPRTGRSSGHD
jgi:signal transduction histidine kinase